MNGQIQSEQASTATITTIDTPTVYDISDALHRLADLIGMGRVRFTHGKWMIMQVDWQPHLTDIILDVMTNVKDDVIQRGASHVVTRYIGTLNGLCIELLQGVRVKSTEVKPT